MTFSYLPRPAMCGLVVAAVQDDVFGGDGGRVEERPWFASFPLLPVLAVLRPPLLLLLPLLSPMAPPLAVDTVYCFRRGGNDVDSCCSRQAPPPRPLDAHACETIALAAVAPPFRVPLQHRLPPPLASEIMASPGGLVWGLLHSLFLPRRSCASCVNVSSRMWHGTVRTEGAAKPTARGARERGARVSSNSSAWWLVGVPRLIG